MERAEGRAWRGGKLLIEPHRALASVNKNLENFSLRKEYRMSNSSYFAHSPFV